jgi:putative Mg2+ transporter-C (MgtC) family protein
VVHSCHRRTVGSGLPFFPVAGTLAVLGANTLLRPLAQAIDRKKDSPDAEISYLVRLTCRATDENHVRSLLLQAVGGQPLLLRSLESKETENSGTVRVRATLMSTGHLDNLLEQIGVGTRS